MRGWKQCFMKAVRKEAIDHHDSTGNNCIFERSKSFSTPNTRRYSTSEDTRWLWEVSDVIKQYNEGNKHGTRTGGLEYTFSSVQPLEPEHFYQAFELFMQKAPNMRTVVRKRADDSFWYCQLPNYKIDFQVLSNEDTFADDCSAVLDKGFQETDSLPWKARVIRKETTAHSPILGISKTHTYQCRLNMMFNHAVTDGTDMRFFNSCLLQSLNCILGGVSPDETELGVFENNKDFEKLLQERERKLLEDPTKISSIRRSLPVLVRNQL
ncbi:uncharacterized protein LOC135226274 [Macrobrachium nipponense]|uniref:uncharacterized protein LOC135226274 n=1 Tax=Macrobrachium nipponense TaxID=159736 RepID=UPI0030C87613